HPVQLQSEILQSVQSEDRHVGPRRAVEADAPPHRLHGRGDRRLIWTRGDKPAAMDVEILARTAAARHADRDLRQAHLLQVAARAQRMQPYAIGHLAWDAQHRLAYRGD